MDGLSSRSPVPLAEKCDARLEIKLPQRVLDDLQGIRVISGAATTGQCAREILMRALYGELGLVRWKHGRTPVPDQDGE